MSMKPFRERNPVVIGAVSFAVLALLFLAAFRAQDLPLIGGGMSVLVGQTLLGTRFLLGAVAALVPLDVALLVLTIRLFRRESILTRWR